MKAAEERGEIVATFTELSPGHNQPRFIYHSEEEDVAGFKLIDPETKANLGELKDSGGMCVGAGSIHPNGKKYVVLRALPLETTSRAELLSILKDYVDMKDELADIELAAEEFDSHGIKMEDLVDLTKFKQGANGEWVGPHPMHGSTTKHNCSVNTKKQCFHCWRHGTGGGPVQYLAMMMKLLDCADCKSGALTQAEVKKVVAYARRKSLINEERKVLHLVDYVDNNAYTILLPLKEKLLTFSSVRPTSGNVEVLTNETPLNMIDTELERYLGIVPQNYHVKMCQVAEGLKNMTGLANGVQNRIVKNGLEKTIYYYYSEREEYYYTILCWSVGSWLHRLFSTFPHLIFFGLRETGKTTILTLLKMLTACMLEKFISPTGPLLFRAVELLRPTVILDEAHKAFHKNPDLETLFEANEVDSVVPRMATQNIGGSEVMVPALFHPYSPKAFGTRKYIAAIEKGIVVHTSEAPKVPAYEKRREEVFTDPDLIPIVRDEIVFALSYWPQVLEEFNLLNPTGLLHGRDFVLWRPILAVCKVLMPDKFEKLVKFAEETALERRKERAGQDIDDISLKILMENLELEVSTATTKVHLFEFTNWLQEELGTEVIRSSRKPRDSIHRLGIISKEDKDDAGVFYYINIEALKKKVERRGIKFTSRNHEPKPTHPEEQPNLETKPSEPTLLEYPTEEKPKDLAKCDSCGRSDMRLETFRSLKLCSVCKPQWEQVAMRQEKPQKEATTVGASGEKPKLVCEHCDQPADQLYNCDNSWFCAACKQQYDDMTYGKKEQEDDKQ
jgi:hypothetical protein